MPDPDSDTSDLRPLEQVRLPPSKSIGNRALLLASLAEGESVFRGFHSQPQPDDVRLMFEALRALNVGNSIQNGDLRIHGGDLHSPSGPISVGEAGTVLRFLLPLAALRCHGQVRFSGAKRLFERPLKPLLDALNAIGAGWRQCENGGLLIPPKVKPGAIDLEIDGTLSSQFISGMALAMAALPNGGILKWTKPPVSLGYVSLTETWLKRFHCQARHSESGFEVPGGSLKPIEVSIPGDWSAAAVFFCASAVMGRSIDVFPLDPGDRQPDAAILPILGKAGASWDFEGDTCHFRGCLNASIQADLIGCPDLAPVLAATAALAPGVSELKGLNTLPHKESDRLQGIVRLVNWLGGKVEKTDFDISIHPGSSPCHSDEPFDTKGDHRMAFAAALGGLRGGGKVLNTGCVSKSFPGFWEAWRQATGRSPDLGGAAKCL